jgi:hypothetical protein
MDLVLAQQQIAYALLQKNFKKLGYYIGELLLIIVLTSQDIFDLSWFLSQRDLSKASRKKKLAWQFWLKGVSQYFVKQISCEARGSTQASLEQEAQYMTSLTELRKIFRSMCIKPDAKELQTEVPALILNTKGSNVSIAYLLIQKK